MRQITDKSIYLWVLKWLPVIGTALIASHYAMLPFGYKSFIIDYITGVEPLLCVIAAIVLAYASEWASLCLFAANKLYDTLWLKIKNQHRRRRR